MVVGPQLATGAGVLDRGARLVGAAIRGRDAPVGPCGTDDRPARAGEGRGPVSGAALTDTTNGSIRDGIPPFRREAPRPVESALLPVVTFPLPV